jgi:hypothetical protein
MVRYGFKSSLRYQHPLEFARQSSRGGEFRIERETK